MTNTQMKLIDLGYDTFFKIGLKDLGLKEFQAARVIAEYKEAYRVRSINGEYLAKITGKQMYTATKREDYPAVGDWVAITELPEKLAVILGIAPRKTILKKKYSSQQTGQIIATNIDTAFIVESIDRDYNLNRFERHFVLAEQGGIKPVIILNKIDLIPESELSAKITELKERFGNIDIFTTSTFVGKGLIELSNFIEKGKTYCFLGSSGVGKSSLINKLLGKDEIKTREINIAIERGKHTTTTRSIYFLEKGGIVIDNPGTREVGIGDSSYAINNVFSEIGLLSGDCRFANCTHIHEPGCSVLEALEKNLLDKNQYENYIKLKNESEYYEMNNIEKRAKNRKFGRFIKSAKKDLEKADSF